MTIESTGNYVGSADDYSNDKVIVWERNESGRYALSYDAPRYMFVEDNSGDFVSMYGTKLKKLVFDSKDEFNAAKKLPIKKFESDISPLQRVLMDEYYNKPIPQLHYAFFDIEAEVISKARDLNSTIKIRKKS